MGVLTMGLDGHTGPLVWLDGCRIGPGNAISMLTSKAQFQTMHAAKGTLILIKQIYQFLSCMYKWLSWKLHHRLKQSFFESSCGDPHFDSSKKIQKPYKKIILLLIPYNTQFHDPFLPLKWECLQKTRPSKNDRVRANLSQKKNIIQNSLNIHKAYKNCDNSANFQNLCNFFLDRVSLCV